MNQPYLIEAEPHKPLSDTSGIGWAKIGFTESAAVLACFIWS